MEATIVSMTDKYGKTGNVDYNDCRIPTDRDLVTAARKYKLSEEIVFTITSVVGTKTKFKANVEKGKLVRLTKETCNVGALQHIALSVCTQEVDKLIQYKDVDYNTSHILGEIKLTEEEVWDMVEKRKRGLWFNVPEKFNKAMFNRVVAEYLTDKLVDGTF